MRRTKASTQAPGAPSNLGSTAAGPRRQDSRLRGSREDRRSKAVDRPGQHGRLKRQVDRTTQAAAMFEVVIIGDGLQIIVVAESDAGGVGDPRALCSERVSHNKAGCHCRCTAPCFLLL